MCVCAYGPEDDDGRGGHNRHDRHGSNHGSNHGSDDRGSSIGHKTQSSFGKSHSSGESHHSTGGHQNCGHQNSNAHHHDNDGGRRGHNDGHGRKY